MFIRHNCLSKTLLTLISWSLLGLVASGALGAESLEIDSSRELFITAVPVVDEKSQLVGMVSRDDLHRSLNQGANPKQTTVAQVLGHKPLLTVFADDDLVTTLDRFYQHEVERACVVERDNPRKLVGIISATDLLQARIEIELVMSNPDTAQTLALPDEALDELHAAKTTSLGTSPSKT